MRRTTSALIAAAFLAAPAVVTSSSSALEPTVAAPGHHVRVSPYVALGDSYSATGIAPVEQGVGGSECGRSDVTYSHLVADRLGVAKFRDAACGGADTKDFFRSQHPGVPAQLKAVKKSTRFVTMTIGGNDGNVFSGLVTSCAIASLAERNSTGSISGHPCKTQYGASFRQKITQETYPNVVEALQAVRDKAPKATVAILGYPQILPATGSAACYGSVPISLGDVPYLDRTQRVLNRVIQRAAAKTGAEFVDMADAAAGHDACQPVGTRWIEPLVGATSTTLHPNVAGHAAMADQVIAQLGL